MNTPETIASGRVPRHTFVTRINHWLMAACMIALLLTGFLPILGIQFAWVTLHWVCGVIFTVSVLFHVVYALTRQDWRAMWIAPREFADTLSSLSGSVEALKISPGKYWLMQKVYHHIVALMSLIAIVTGILMLLKIDSPFWTRDPYLFSAETWGIIYVLHDFSSLCFILLVMMHIYFAIRPEKLFYARSMVKGWITDGEYRAHHDPEKWAVKDPNRKGS